MSNFSFNPNSSHHPEPPLDIMRRLGELQEMEDESRGEQCPVSLLQESLRRSRPTTPFAPQHVPTQINILEELDKQSAPACSATQKKLQSDNIKLFGECIRLRKLCSTQQKELHQMRREAEERVRATEEENRQLWTELEELRLQKRRVEERVQQMVKEVTAAQILQAKHDRVCLEKAELEGKNQQLLLRVAELKEELTVVNSRTTTRSTTSMDSHRTNPDSQRKLHNIKIVHQSQVRKLKLRIQELSSQLEQLSCGGKEVSQ